MTHEWKIQVENLSVNESKVLRTHLTYESFKIWIKKYKKKTGKDIVYKVVEPDLFIVTRLDNSK